MSRKKPLIIGLVGTSGSGKTTTACYLKKKGYYSITLSDYIKKEARKKGCKRFSKKLLQDLGNKMRAEFGPQILAQLAVKDTRESNTKKAVIDGIRNVYEVAFLETEDRFFLLGIDAGPNIRYQRIIKSKGKKWVGEFEDFLKIEKRDSELGKKEIGLRVKDCLKRAYKIIKNNKTIEDFYSQLDKLLTKIDNKKKQ